MRRYGIALQYTIQHNPCLSSPPCVSIDWNILASDTKPQGNTQTVTTAEPHAQEEKEVRDGSSVFRGE